MPSPRLLPAMTLFVSFFACGDDDEGPSSGLVSPQEAESSCSDACEHGVECGWWESQADCERECYDASDLVRADVFRYGIDCHLDLACEDEPEVCDERTENAFDSLPYHDSFVRRCIERLVDCGTGEALAEELCDPEDLYLVAEEIVRQAESCFDEPCNQILECIGDVLD